MADNLDLAPPIDIRPEHGIITRRGEIIARLMIKQAQTALADRPPVGTVLPARVVNTLRHEPEEWRAVIDFVEDQRFSVPRIGIANPGALEYVLRWDGEHGFAITSAPGI